MSVPPIPDGYHSITPYLIVSDAKRAIDWYVNAFNAEKHLQLNTADGGIAHAEIQIGNSIVMLAGEFPGMGIRSPEHFGGSPMSLMIYCANVDMLVQQAVDQGAEVVRPLQDQFYGDRTATLKDPFGHQWTIATHVEEVSLEEAQKRFAEIERSSE